MNNKINSLLLSFAAILTLTGLGKIWSAFGSAKVLGIADPLLGLQFKYLMFVAGALELLLAGLYFFPSNKRLFLYSVAWLSAVILFYRISLTWIGWHQPCSCMGYFAEALHIPARTADTLMIIVLGYLLIGSYSTLFLLWRQRRSASTSMSA